MEQKIKQIVRIANTDVNGNLSIFRALRRVKGISFSFSNAICNSLDLDKGIKIGIMNENDLKKIEEVISNPKKYSIPSWLLNRRKDYETGEDKHLIISKLELQKDFDIKRLKKIKSYRGIRHALGLPSRGQRTRGHFRKGRAIGVQRKKVKIASSKPKDKKK